MRTTAPMAASLSVLSLILGLAACGSAKEASKSNFSKAIQAYLDTKGGLCVAVPAKEIPFRLSHPDIWVSHSKKVADALVDAGLLTRREIEVTGNNSKKASASEYQITAMGKKYLVEGSGKTIYQNAAFCTGQYTDVEIKNFTEPGDMMGMEMSHVLYRYKLEGAADWAKTPNIQTIFQHFEKQLKEDISEKAALILTDQGWKHERLMKL